MPVSYLFTFLSKILDFSKTVDKFSRNFFQNISNFYAFGRWKKLALISHQNQVCQEFFANRLSLEFAIILLSLSSSSYQGAPASNSQTKESHTCIHLPFLHSSLAIHNFLANIFVFSFLNVKLSQIIISNFSEYFSSRISVPNRVANVLLAHL